MNETKLFLPSYSRDLGHDIVKDFFEPCLAHAIQYDRATGDFCSSFLSAGALGFSDFFLNNGEMRLITNGRFTENDFNALKVGTNKSELAEKIIEQELLRLEKLCKSAFHRRHTEIFSWLLGNHQIQLKVALVKQNDKVVPVDQSHGVFHSKIGIFYNEDGSIISFIGGLNESQRAMLYNSESFDPAYSWRGHSERIQHHINQFETLWNNDSTHSEVLDFPEAAARELVTKYTPRNRPKLISEKELDEYQIEEHLEFNDISAINYELREYQESRILEWIDRDYRGILSMATGTGKTLTAIDAAKRWTERHSGSPCLVVISAPQTHIVEQWVREVERFAGINPLASVGRASWTEEFANWIVLANAGIKNNCKWIVVTNDALITHISTGIRTLTAGKNIRILLIADEAHSLGTKNASREIISIRDSIDATLGLTATPERHFDDEGTKRLFHNFGETLSPYTISNAISDGWLCPYDYTFYIRHLTDNEFEEYKKWTKELKPYLFEQEGGIDFASLERARVLSEAASKIEFLSEILDSLPNEHLLFYCSPGHLGKVSEILKTHGYRRAQITYRTKLADRMRILDSFSKGTYQALVAIECLDEGVDIPEARTAVFLASTTNPKQYIQRRGRILRLAPGKDRASIHDVLVAPPFYVTGEEKCVFQREIRRALAFAQDALNRDSIMTRINEIRIWEDANAEGISNVQVKS